MLLSTSLFGQSIDKKTGDAYIKAVDALLKQKKLVKITYPDKAACAGLLEGYYYQDKLVLMTGMDRGELGYTSHKIYMKDSVVLKVEYREHFAEWEKYDARYPRDKFEWDESKMTYTDTLNIITVGPPMKFERIAGKKIASRKIDQKLVDAVQRCSIIMRKQLEEIVKGNSQIELHDVK